MDFLTRNLDQLTLVQKQVRPSFRPFKLTHTAAHHIFPEQLVDQNTTLKRDVALAERKLIARNERIQNLEALLQDANEKVNQQNAKFEARLQAVKERLDQARGKSAPLWLIVTTAQHCALWSLRFRSGADSPLRSLASAKPAGGRVEPQLWPHCQASPRWRCRSGPSVRDRFLRAREPIAPYSAASLPQTGCRAPHVGLLLPLRLGDALDTVLRTLPAESDLGSPGPSAISHPPLTDVAICPLPLAPRRFPLLRSVLYTLVSSHTFVVPSCQRAVSICRCRGGRLRRSPRTLTSAVARGLSTLTSREVFAARVACRSALLPIVRTPLRTARDPRLGCGTR